MIIHVKKFFKHEFRELKGVAAGDGVDGSSLSPCESISLAALVSLIYRGLLKWSPFGRLPAAPGVLTPVRAAR